MIYLEMNNEDARKNHLATRELTSKSSTVRPQCEAIAAYMVDHFSSAICQANAFSMASADSCKSTAPILPSLHTPGEEEYRMGLFFLS